MPMLKINLPDGARSIIEVLQQSGFEAYVVGGCVRDSLWELTPHDWDICTSAKPEDIVRCFQGKYRIIETGLKHGTVTVVMPDEKYEVTTFRIDGNYSDNRRPDSVTFTDDLTADLARRDFTINAMAYNDEAGLVDPFNGFYDLYSWRISCVGDPAARFHEDGLRILRALRFASVFAFRIDEQTATAIHECKGLLKNIAAERINAELCKLLRGLVPTRVLSEYKDVITTIIPELAPCVGFEQNNPYHCFNVYDHITSAVGYCREDDIVIKLALLLHDIGKPHCYTEDEKGGHFHGHGVVSHDIAEKVLANLRFDNKTRDAVLELVLYHDSTIEPTVPVVKRWLNKIGDAQFMKLLKMREADIRAHSQKAFDRSFSRLADLWAVFNKVMRERPCFTLKDLAINGYDVMRLGVPKGKQVGVILNAALDGVISGELANTREDLIEFATRHLRLNEEDKQ